LFLVPHTACSHEQMSQGTHLHTLPIPAVQDWEEREFVESLNANVKKIIEFLNKFETTTRYQLAVVNEKLSSLERQVDYLEATLLKSRHNNL